jgi:hypothetical protein
MVSRWHQHRHFASERQLGLLVAAVVVHLTMEIRLYWKYMNCVSIFENVTMEFGERKVRSYNSYHAEVMWWPFCVLQAVELSSGFLWYQYKGP